MACTPVSLRQKWTLAVNGSCQTAVGALVDLDSARFAEAFERLAETLPAAKWAEEHLFLHDRLQVFSQSAGCHFHQGFHDRIDRRPCGASPVEATCEIWNDAATDPRDLLVRWCHSYVDAFERHHRWPPAFRVIQQLYREFRSPVTIAGLALSAQASRSVVIRGFAHEFGMSVHQYQRLLRVRAAAVMLNRTSWSVDCVATLVGFKSTKNLYAGLRILAATCPDDLRRASSAQVEDMLTTSLRLPSDSPAAYAVDTTVRAPTG